MKKFILFLFVLITVWPIEAKNVANELVKVFHHRMNEHEHKHVPSLEVAKITFYFSQEPVVKKTEIVSKNSWHEITFSIPGIKSSSPEIMTSIQKFNTVTAKDYSLIARLEQSGLQLTIRYNPAKIVVRSQKTISIKQEKVLEIVLYDKTLEQTLSQKSMTVLRYTQANKPTIIIDCGHGGHDTGTIGCFKTVEKDITLAVGLKLKKELEKNHYNVMLTRLDDRFLALDERTSFANRCKDNALLISLHANNASKETVSGLETYCLSAELYKPLDYQLATSLDVIIGKSEQMRFTQGQQLAHFIHANILKAATTNGYQLTDRHVKKATAQILSGLVFPGILVEMGFLSNPTSAQLLIKPEYQDKVIVAGICSGLQEYFDLFSFPKKNVLLK